MALDYLKSLKPNGIQKGKYFKEQLMGDETIYHTLDFVNAHQSLAEKVGEKKYVKTLERTSAQRPAFLNDPPTLPKTAAVSPEKLKEIRQRVRDRNAIILVIEDRGPLTVSEISEILKIEKSMILRHLTALRQFGQVAMISERNNQPVYELTLNMP